MSNITKPVMLDDTGKSVAQALGNVATAINNLEKVQWGQVKGTLSNQTDLNNNLNSLQSQIDSFTALSDGSTTGDAELTNIRVDSAGHTYSTAGDAVRAIDAQVRDMKTGFDGVTYSSPAAMVQTCDAEIFEINQITRQFAEYGIADVPLHVGYWDATTGAWNSNTSSYKSTRKIPVNGGDKLVLNVTDCICVYYYADGTKKTFESGHQFWIPNDVRFVGIDVPTAQVPESEIIQIVSINAFNSKVESIDTKADNTYTKTSVSLTMVAKKMIGSTGNIITYDNSDYKVSEAITVTPGEYYLVRGSADYTNSYYTVHDSNDRPIINKNNSSGSGSTVVTVNDIVRIPPMGAKLYVAEKGSATAALSKITFDTGALLDLTSDVEGTQEELTAVKKAVDSIALPIYENATGETTTGYIFDVSGNKVSYLDGKIFEADVTPYETIKVNAYVYSTQAYCVFYDGDGGIIGTANGTGSGFQSITDQVLTVPVGAESAAVVAITSHEASILTVASYKTGAKWLGKKWVCVGDSLTEHNLRTTKNYHDYVAEATGITVVNMGLSGTGYMRQQDNNNAFYQRILNVPTDADVITIFGSGNDLSQPLGEVTDTGTTTICGCINTTFDNLYSVFPLAQIGVITPTPWIGNPPSNPNDAMSKYSAALVEICRLRGIPCLDLFHCSNLRPDDATFRQLAYSKDEGNGVHPDETGHKMIAPHFEAFLDSLLLS